jgi:hypothetical protein
MEKFKDLFGNKFDLEKLKNLEFKNLQKPVIFQVSAYNHLLLELNIILFLLFVFLSKITEIIKSWRIFDTDSQFFSRGAQSLK